LTALRQFGGAVPLKQAAAGQTFGYKALHRQPADPINERLL